MIKQLTRYNNGATVSIWQQDTSLISWGALDQSRNADICIIGGGIVGLTAAYLLAQEGASVTLLEALHIGAGQTGLSTAHLSNAFDDHYQVIEALHGLGGAKAVAKSHTKAIDSIEKLVQQENMDCGFERLDGYLWVAPENDSNFLKKEVVAAHRAGLKDVAWLNHLPIASLAESPCLRFPNQAQINPLRYLLQLAQAATTKGVKIFDQTRVTKLKVGKHSVVMTQQGCQVKAKHIIIATNSPINDKLAIHAKQASYRTYVIGAKVPKGSVCKALYWDTANPYHYVRLHSGLNFVQEAEWKPYDLLLVGGEDHQVGHIPANFQPYKRLEAWTRSYFPMVKDIPFRWSGQVQEPIDHLAFIGRDPLNSGKVYLATGDSGNGMTHGTIAGLLLTDLIVKRKNTWKPYYTPSRIPTKLAYLKALVAHNLANAKAYSAYVTPGEVKSMHVITTGSGAVIRHALHKIAVYRDQDGQCYQYSAVCRHLKCIVAWNPLEKSWDCPCHGSRYDRFGKVINGPSTENLKPFDASVSP
jgi:glycine/D-amino acid oxidase-like deaminating enzyme/nitrite reductase/ring-hydroxylating ferredoxin subunit